MIVKLWNKPHVIYQTSDPMSSDLANDALIVHIDNGGTLFLEQENHPICVDWETIPELCKLLTQLRKEHKK